LDELLAGSALNLDVMARDHEWHARLTRGGRWLLSKGRPSVRDESDTATEPELPPHDRKKTHPLDSDDPQVRQLFIETGLFGKNGRLLGEAADKYRQVQHYLELLRPLTVWQSEGPVRVVDAGCGKAYLSLALYLWAEQQKKRIELVGVDANADIVGPVAESAKRLGYGGARFETQSIADFTEGRREPVDLLVSLHACDTATDEALAAGARLGAKAIVLVPCCHHELTEQIERARKASQLPAEETWSAALEPGLLRHRIADVVTDSLRGAALEALGYRVDIAEFVSPEVTARNLMIRAQKRSAGPGSDRAARTAYRQYRSLALGWSVAPSMERLLGENWPPAFAEEVEAEMLAGLDGREGE
jgi:SAM-dependent methyltransferase